MDVELSSLLTAPEHAQPPEAPANDADEARDYPAKHRDDRARNFRGSLHRPRHAR